MDRLTYYGTRCSTNRGIGVPLDEALEVLAPDYWRYYLMANAPEAGETDFTWEVFADAVNADLVDGLGSFIGRSLWFARKHFGHVVPSGGPSGLEEARLARALDAHISELTTWMSAVEFRKAMSQLRNVWDQGNAYLARKRPCLSIERDPEDAARTVQTCINLIALLARLSAPFIPFTAERVLDALCVPEEGRAWPTRFDAGALAPGHGFSVPSPLFRKIEERDIALWRDRFGAPPDHWVAAQDGLADLRV